MSTIVLLSKESALINVSSSWCILVSLQFVNSHLKKMQGHVEVAVPLERGHLLLAHRFITAAQKYLAGTMHKV